MASHLHMSKQRCQRETTATEFLGWLAFLELENTTFQKRDYYLANIVHWIKKTIAKNPDDVKFEDSLIKFETKKGLTKEEKEQNRKDRLQKMKVSIYNWLGVNREN